jgi:hypothetical protein
VGPRADYQVSQGSPLSGLRPLSRRVVSPVWAASARGPRVVGHLAPLGHGCARYARVGRRVWAAPKEWVFLFPFPVILVVLL